MPFTSCDVWQTPAPIPHTTALGRGNEREKKTTWGRHSWSKHFLQIRKAKESKLGEKKRLPYKHLIGSLSGFISSKRRVLISSVSGKTTKKVAFLSHSTTGNYNRHGGRDRLAFLKLSVLHRLGTTSCAVPASWLRLASPALPRKISLPPALTSSVAAHCENGLEREQWWIPQEAT